MGFHNTAKQGIVLAEGLARIPAVNPHPKTSEYHSQGSKTDNRGGFAAFKFPQYTLVTPQKFCISIVSNFSWDLQSSQENLKIILFVGGGGGRGGGGGKKGLLWLM